MVEFASVMYKNKKTVSNQGHLTVFLYSESITLAKVISNLKS